MTGRFALLLSIYLIFPAVSNAGIPEIKVLIAKSLSRINVRGTDLEQKDFRSGSNKLYPGNKSIQFLCNRPNANLATNPILLASLSSSTGLIGWEKKKYLGELQLVSSHENNNCDLVNVISIENYLSSLLSKEMNSEWPEEALKAQAVAARSYALHKIKSQETTKLLGKNALYDLESSEKHQVSGSYFDITKKTNMVTKETSGEVLLNKTGELKPVFFHSKCGGKTLKPEDVWGGVIAGYESVNCPFCHRYGKNAWNKEITNQEFVIVAKSILKKYYANDVKISASDLLIPTNQNSNEIRFYNRDILHTIKKSMLRNFTHRELFPSNNFTLEQSGNKIQIKGTGYGHGVGLCQLGAVELAKRGYNYKQILSFYYPGFELKKMY
jgi:stage II sporulation protein D